MVNGKRGIRRRGHHLCRSRLGFVENRSGRQLWFGSRGSCLYRYSSTGVRRAHRCQFCRSVFLDIGPPDNCLKMLESNEVHDDAMGQDPVAGIFSTGTRVPVPQKGVWYDQTALPNTFKFKRHGRDDNYTSSKAYVCQARF